MIDTTRPSKASDAVVGACLKAFDGAFGTSIIVKIGDGIAYLERPHASIGRFGTVNLMVERYTTTLDSIRRGEWTVWTRDSVGTLAVRVAGE